MITAEPDTAGTIIGLERAALERWGRGDPDGFIEMIEPRLQIAGGIAVLTYHFDSHGSEGSMR